MGWLDKLKVRLGVVDPEDIEGEDEPRAQLRINPRSRDQDGRPPLDDIKPPPQESLEDALKAREAGNLEEMHRLFEQIDVGRGLRTVLRAAAALEAGDDDTLKKLLPRVRGEQPSWRLPLQVAAALCAEESAEPGAEDARVETFRKRAEELAAPKWAMAWSDASSDDADRRRHGLVALLFADMALARTVASRDLGMPDVDADNAAASRYTSFAHGRDCIRRFGASIVADLLERAAS